MKKILRFIRSMKFGMILLILVMALSLAGSLIPQQDKAMRYVSLYGDKTAALLIGLGATDIFHTWYFYALEILLCLNLVLCSILRFPSTRKAAEEWQKKAEYAEIDQPLSEGQRLKLEEYLSTRRYGKAARDGGAVYRKNALGFYGSFLTHLSILLVLLFGSLVLLTPDIQDRTLMPGDTLTLDDGTQITCDSFHIEDETGKLDYASVLTAASADGKEAKQQEVRVNTPLRFGAYKIYQHTYGTAGQVKITNRKNGAEDLVTLTEPTNLLIDPMNGVIFNALYPAYLVDADGNYTLITNTSGSYPDPVYDIRSISGGMSASMLAFPGEELVNGDIAFTFLDPVEYPGLRIKHVSPWLFGGLYFSFGLMVLALYLCFFAVPVYVSVKDDGYAVLSPKIQEGLLIDLRSLLEEKEEST